MEYSISFNQPTLTGKELEYISDAIRRGHASSDGSYTRRCSGLLESILGAPRVVLTTSCTSALEMTAILLDLRPGDEVIVPSFTFVSTINAFVLRGARPVFADVRADTLNLDERQLESLVTPRTKAIVVVHYAGVAAEMDPILEVARRHGIAVVEDNAHGLFAAYRGRPLGTLGAYGTLSFHETKNISCGEGGALVVNDAANAARAEIVKDKGTNRSVFLKGLVDKYTWVDIGSSYGLSDLLAAFLFAQLEARESIHESRRRIWTHYAAALADWAKENGATLPFIPEHCDSSYHMFHLVLPSEQERDGLIERLRDHGIMGVFHYQPLHLSPMGKRFGGAPGDCPVTERTSGRLVRLPFYNDLTEADQRKVVAAIVG